MTVSETEGFLHTFLHEISGESSVEVVIVPPFTALSKASEVLGREQKAKLGAQNMHWEKSGAFTGEINAAMLRELYVRYVVLGHSERRTLFGETDEVINRKVRAAIDAALRPIVCVGETLEERDAGHVGKILRRHVETSLQGVTARELADIVIAYEPVWAIGTGRTATPEQAQEAHAYIRQLLTELYDSATAEKVRIQYGGSEKPQNAAELMREKDIDGALVGGASLDPRGFAEIVKAAAAV